MTSDRTRLDTKLESEGAEFLVLGQLLIAKIHAYKAYTNFRGFDLVAISSDGRKTARIQVKSRWKSSPRHWLIKDVDECEFVVLVRLNRDAPGKDPEYFVFTAHEADALIVDRDAGWGKIRWSEQAFEPHLSQWDRIGERLANSEKQTVEKAK
jgi:hypothetical protein